MKRARRSRARAQSLLLPGVELTPARAVTPIARATASQRRDVEAPSPVPWAAVVLAVDTARTSGWAITSCGSRVGSGEVDTEDSAEVERVVEWAVTSAGDFPVVLVLEKAWGGNVNIVSALGAARERWLRPWRDAGQARGRVVLVNPATWRSAVLGGYWVSAKRENVRVHEQLVARHVKGSPAGPDEAAAILIARWASHAAVVGKAVGKRAIKASLAAWVAKHRRVTR